MTKALAKSETFLPLFVWPELQTAVAEITALKRARDELTERIERLPRYSHRRLIIEARLRSMTEEQLRLECVLRAKLQ